MSINTFLHGFRRDGDVFRIAVNDGRRAYVVASWTEDRLDYGNIEVATFYADEGFDDNTLFKVQNALNAAQRLADSLNDVEEEED